MYRMSTPANSISEVAKILDATLTTMKAEQYCFLITLDENGQPQSRMVAAANIEPDMKVWIIGVLKHGRSRRFNEIAELQWHSLITKEKDTSA